MVTHSICPRCIAKIEAQMHGAERIDATFPCPNCPREAKPYRVVTTGDHRSLYVRCHGCDLAWIVEA